MVVRNTVRRRLGGGGRAAFLGLLVLAGCVTERETRTSFDFEGSQGGEETKTSSIRSKIAVLERRVEALPERIDLREELADYYFKDEQYDKGIDEIKEAIAKDPANARLYYRLGDYYIYMNRFAEAEDSYRRLVENSKPGFSGPRLALGYVQAMQGKNEEALEQFETVLQITPTLPTALFYAGCCCDLVGDRKQALDYFARCAEIESPYQRKARGEISRLEKLGSGKGAGSPSHFTKEGLSGRSTAER